MEKFIPYEKLSKKEQKKQNALKRKTWGSLSPVTRRPQPAKAYNRAKARRWKRDASSNAGPSVLLTAAKYAMISL